MLGIDLVYIQEFRKQLELGGDTFLRKAFHDGEVRSQSAEHIAGLWAAKEAVTKAAGLPPGSWLDIHISRDDAGKPMAEVAGQRLEISIAHHGDYAVAVALQS